ncbi:MAG: hypothetical protein QG636_697 [Patescibacteria group bacterium]|nr:hypothetical protein [Patescibacteria group bacterium]
MAEATYRMQALVVLREGMRLFYDCPSMSGESFESDNFFRKYKGKTGIIAGFPITLVGPFDSKGRLPGSYLTPGYMHVRFEGEEEFHQSLNLHHFVLLDPTTTVTDEEFDEAQRSGDLPHPILFYPGDTVYKQDDLLQVRRVVQEVKFGTAGIPLYVLSETSEATERRMADKAADHAEREARREASPDNLPLLSGFCSHDRPETETCEGTNLVLLERGHSYYLYHDPSKLSFASAEEELDFWSQDGLSKTFYGPRRLFRTWEWSLAQARALLEEGKGDLIVTSRMPRGRRDDSEQKYTVRILHAGFAEYRDRVRQLALSIAPPLEKEKTFAELGRGLLDL